MSDTFKSESNERNLATAAAIVLPILHDVPHLAPWMAIFNAFVGRFAAVAIGHAAVAGTLVNSVEKR